MPQLSELEWPIKPLLEEWADVASFDAPGVGSEPADRPLSHESVARRALAELDARGWDSCVVVADEWSLANAIGIARQRPRAVAAMALGHACLSFSPDGPEAAVRAGVMDALSQTARTNFRTWARHMTQITRGAYDDALTEQFLARVPQELAMELFRSPDFADAGPVRETLEPLGVPLLFAEHTECLLFTHEGFEAAVAALPDARVIRLADKPSVSPEFAAALRDLCAVPR